MYFNTKAAASTKGGDLGIHQCKHRTKSGAVWMYDDACGRMMKDVAHIVSSVIRCHHSWIRSLSPWPPMQALSEEQCAQGFNLSSLWSNDKCVSLLNSNPKVP